MPLDIPPAVSAIQPDRIGTCAIPPESHQKAITRNLQEQQNDAHDQAQQTVQCQAETEAVKPKKKRKPAAKPRNVFEHMQRHDNNSDYEPQTSKDFKPTDAEPGSPKKIEVLRRRVEKGQPLWHPTDKKYINLPQ